MTIRLTYLQKLHHFIRFKILHQNASKEFTIKLLQYLNYFEISTLSHQFYATALLLAHLCLINRILTVGVECDSFLAASESFHVKMHFIHRTSQIEFCF